jgi:hypothetical protein
MKKATVIIVGMFCALLAMLGILAIVPGVALVYLAIFIQEKMEE